MRFTPVLITLIALKSFAAQASLGSDFHRAPLAPVCASGVAWDSFHVGAALELMSGLNFEFRYISSLNARCVQLGRESGKEVKTQYLFGSRIQKACERDFVRGQIQGRKFSSETGNPCFGVGYLLGLAELHDGLRRGDVQMVSDECGKQYVRGVSDAKAQRPGCSSGSNDLEQHCYDLGWFESHRVND